MKRKREIHPNPENRVGYMPVSGLTYLGPERASYPGGNSPYTGRTMTFRGHVLHELNIWTRSVQRWVSRETSISVLGPGERAPAGGRWLARIANMEADGETALEALEEAWQLAESARRD